jgi:selenide,water dikinase
VSASTRFDAGVSEIDRVLLADAQTSGGLLLAVPAENEARLLAELEAQGTLTRAVIGEVVTGAAGAIEVVPD